MKYSSNEAGAGGEVRQEMEKSPQGKEHPSSGDTRERGKSDADKGGRKRRRERNVFIVWELVVKIPHMVDENSPHNSGGGFMIYKFIKHQVR